MSLQNAAQAAHRMSGSANVQIPVGPQIVAVLATGARYRVRSGSDPREVYTVTLAPESCECKDHLFRQHACKHIAAAHAYEAERASLRAARPLCPVCKLNYLTGMATCSAACHAILVTESLIALPAPAPVVVEPAEFCHCVKSGCGARYAFVDGGSLYCAAHADSGIYEQERRAS